MKKTIFVLLILLILVSLIVNANEFVRNKEYQPKIIYLNNIKITVPFIKIFQNNILLNTKDIVVDANKIDFNTDRIRLKLTPCNFHPFRECDDQGNIVEYIKGSPIGCSNSDKKVIRNCNQGYDPNCFESGCENKFSLLGRLFGGAECKTPTPRQDITLNQTRSCFMQESICPPQLIKSNECFCPSDEIIKSRIKIDNLEKVVPIIKEIEKNQDDPNALSNSFIKLGLGLGSYCLVREIGLDKYFENLQDEYLPRNIKVNIDKKPSISWITGPEDCRFKTTGSANLQTREWEFSIQCEIKFGGSKKKS